MTEKTQYSHHGLRLKSNEAVGGGDAHQGLYALAHDLQNVLGNQLKYYTAFNDTYHHSESYFKRKGNRNPGFHGAGLATDIALNNPKESSKVVNLIHQQMAAKGLKAGRDYKIIDEYAKPSRGATGGHLDLRFTNAQAAQKYLSGEKAVDLSINTSVAYAPKKMMQSVPNTPTITMPEIGQVSAQPIEIDHITPVRKSDLTAFFNTTQPAPTINPNQYTENQSILNDLKIKQLDFNDYPEHESKIAQAFGEYPDMSAAIPDYIDSLIQSIYDKA